MQLSQGCPYHLWLYCLHNKSIYEHTNAHINHDTSCTFTITTNHRNSTAFNEIVKLTNKPHLQIIFRQYKLLRKMSWDPWVQLASWTREDLTQVRWLHPHRKQSRSAKREQEWEDISHSCYSASCLSLFPTLTISENSLLGWCISELPQRWRSCHWGTLNVNSLHLAQKNTCLGSYYI